MAVQPYLKVIFQPFIQKRYVLLYHWFSKMSDFYLAQINVGHLVAPLNSDQLTGFTSALNSINTLADQSPGFVWRLQSEGGDATSIQVFDDELVIINMSIWESVESLKNFTYNSSHGQMIKRRQEWFEKFITSHLALWWIERGQFPTPEEGRQRLELLDTNGPTEYAFTFRKLFDKPV